MEGVKANQGHVGKDGASETCHKMVPQSLSVFDGQQGC